MQLELPSPWAEFLAEIDHRLSSGVELHCVGGFVLTVVYGIPRTTSDLDYVTAIPRSGYEQVELLAGRDSNLARKYRLFLQHTGVADLPENYADRLIPLDLGFSNLALKILDDYDLVLSKLTRNSPKDREDIRAISGKLYLSFQVLMKRFDEEMRPWLPNLERHQQTLRLWHEYFQP